MAIRGNKGEWSEIYTLFKVLADVNLYPGNADLEKIKGLLFPIIKILRTESAGDFEYSIDQDIIIITSSGKKLIRIPVLEFKDNAEILLNAIKAGSGAFEVSEIEDFMSKVYCSTLKANSSTKIDITIVVHDKRNNQHPVLGFSIKSQLGSPATLLNAGRTTNFKYKIIGANFSKKQIEKFNAISGRGKIKRRIEAIRNLKGDFEFVNTEKEVFFNNLVLIDSLLPQIVAEMVLDYYASSRSKTLDLLQNLEKQNSLGFDQSQNHQFYSYKIKRFYTDIALGMMPATVWTGQYDATGGYLVVKEGGDILCYHIYNKNDFEDYLINNTKFDTASSSRHAFGVLYRKNNDTYINLNLQIRFVK